MRRERVRRRPEVHCKKQDGGTKCALGAAVERVCPTAMPPDPGMWSRSSAIRVTPLRGMVKTVLGFHGQSTQIVASARMPRWQHVRLRLGLRFGVSPSVGIP